MHMIGEYAVRVVKFLSAVTLGVLAVAVFINVVLRFGFNSGILATEELSRIFFVWLVFGSAVVVLHGRKHINMTMVVRRLPATAQRWLATLGALLMAFCDVLLFLGAYRQVQFSWLDYYPVSGWTVAVSYIPGLLASGVFIILNLTTFIRLAAGKLSPGVYFGDEQPEQPDEGKAAQ